MTIQKTKTPRTKSTTSKRTRIRTQRTPVSDEGKILESSVTEEMIEERARELAAIDGRHPNQATASDRRQASLEPHGGDHPVSDASDEPEVAGWDWETPVPSSGQSAPQTVPPDDARLAEELVEEGINDAEHDQMVAARKTHK